MLMALLGVKASAWASTAKPTSPASMAASEPASSRLHEEHPRQQAESGGDDGGVDQACPVPSRAAGTDQRHQSGRQRQVPGQIEPIGGRWEGVGVPYPLMQIEEQVTDDEQQLAGGQPPPGDACGWPVAPNP